MKKFLLVTVISLVTLSTTFAAYKFPGWDCKDLAKVNQAIVELQADSGIPASQKENKMLRLTVLKNIIEKNINTFEGIKTEVESVVNASNLSADKKVYVIKGITKSCAMLSRNKQIMQAAAGYVKANKNYKSPHELQFYYRGSLVKNLGLTNDECYDYIINFFKVHPTLGDVDPAIAIQAIKKFVRVCPKVSYTTQKEDLTYLNRIFTRKLIENKTVWEPAVVQIRTALETY